jgi:hypothetical protein
MGAPNVKNRTVNGRVALKRSGLFPVRPRGGSRSALSCRQSGPNHYSKIGSPSERIPIPSLHAGRAHASDEVAASALA